MRTATVVLAFAVAVLLTGTAPGLHAQGGAWTPLFNGRNLDNWEKTGNANWGNQWNYLASYLAIFVEAIVGRAMFGQTRRDARASALGARNAERRPARFCRG